MGRTLGLNSVNQVDVVGMYMVTLSRITEDIINIALPSTHGVCVADVRSNERCGVDYIVNEKSLR